ncbi:hypothetical protein [Streptomyces sp. MP131-18]|uniref:TetR/AcrR family transcriptional regulator n=1 Tax=Streptomyces sp. MP131-18 TaxID=1857892 RepID=UPI00344BC15F
MPRDVETSQVLVPVAQALGRPWPEVPATPAASRLVGVALTRYVVREQPLARIIGPPRSTTRPGRSRCAPRPGGAGRGRAFRGRRKSPGRTSGRAARPRPCASAARAARTAAP